MGNLDSMLDELNNMENSITLRAYLPCLRRYADPVWKFS